MYVAILAGATHVLQNIFVYCSSGAEVAAFRTKWEHAARALRKVALEVSTQKTYASYKRSYLRFCELADYVPVPATPEMVCEYIAYLCDRLAYSSILKYLGIIRVLHLDVGLPDPKIWEEYEVKLALLAAKKCLGAGVKRRLPIGPELLMVMLSKLNMACTNDVVFWAICLVGFFGLLRISNVIGPSKADFDTERHLSRADFQELEDCMVLSLKWAKTNQARERVVEVPIPKIQGSALCPVTAVKLAFSMTQSASKSGPAFLRCDKSGRLIPVQYQWFSRKLLGLVQACGLDKTQYGTHSLRRGGASWALKCGLSSEVVRILGDWHSNAYMCYLEVSLEDKANHMKVFAQAIRQVHV